MNSRPENGLAVGAALDVHRLQVRVRKVQQVGPLDAVLLERLRKAAKAAGVEPRHDLEISRGYCNEATFESGTFEVEWSWSITWAEVHSDGWVLARKGRRRWYTHSDKLGGREEGGAEGSAMRTGEEWRYGGHELREREQHLAQRPQCVPCVVITILTLTA